MAQAMLASLRNLHGRLGMNTKAEKKETLSGSSFKGDRALGCRVE